MGTTEELSRLREVLGFFVGEDTTVLPRPTACPCPCHTTVQPDLVPCPQCDNQSSRTVAPTEAT